MNRKLLVSLVSLGTILSIESVKAQAVLPDRSLNTIVTRSGNVFTIDNGTTSGTHLFHSFQEFSIPTGGSAIFNNATTIRNIFSRVTGGTVSNIDGAIQANGSANLFLLNPAGIIFGANASLNVGGSFVGSTAQAIKFADGMEFSANDLSNPLLTMSVPIGLQMGQNPGKITIQDQGHRLIRGAFTPANRSNNPPGLQVNPGQTLGLIGNGIALEGGILSAPSGQIELGSVSSGRIGLNTDAAKFSFNYSNVQKFADIRFSQQALIDSSGVPVGSIRLQGQDIRFLEGSAALLLNFGNTTAGDLTINAAGLLAAQGLGSYGFGHSLISSDNFRDGSGSNLIISAHDLQLQDGAQIITRNYGSGSSGTIKIDVTDSINMDGFSAIAPASLLTAIITTTYTSGKSGNTNVSADRIRITNGGLISNVTTGLGVGGSTTVHARHSIELIGENPVVSSGSVISASTFNQGAGGSVSVTAPHLMIRDGAGVFANTYGSGSAGEIRVTGLEKIEVSGTSLASGLPSRIGARGELVPPAFQQAFNLPPRPTGNSGSLIINTPSLRVWDKATVGVSHEGVGNAGDLHINAASIELNRGGSLSASTLSGRGGDMTLQTDRLILRRGSNITTTSSGVGRGGNISINAPIILGLENSDIIANSVEDRGGEINITTQGIIGLEFRNTRTPRTDLTNDITASSEIGLNGTVQINHIGVTPNSGLVELPTNLKDASQQIAKDCAMNQGSSFVMTGRGGLPLPPSQRMGNRDRTWSDLRDLSTLQITNAISPSQPEPLVEATSWHRNPQTGNVELKAEHSGQSTRSFTCN